MKEENGMDKARILIKTHAVKARGLWVGRYMLSKIQGVIGKGYRLPRVLCIFMVTRLSRYHEHGPQRDYQSSSQIEAAHEAQYVTGLSWTSSRLLRKLLDAYVV